LTLRETVTIISSRGDTIVDCLMKGGEGCDEGIRQENPEEGGILLADHEGCCYVSNEEMPQVKELKGLGPDVAGLQHMKLRADRVFVLSALTISTFRHDNK
jgi:hypothetical protein